MNKTEEPTTTPFLGSGCRECGSPVMAALNPFHGVDLAVHKYVRNCVECSWTEYASDSLSGSAIDWASSQSRPRDSFWERLNAAISVLRAV